ncbi:MAG TPA: universal stress protein [Stellaceae bacterium]|nr:universal stress protein [Stellaceae bacterium]
MAYRDLLVIVDDDPYARERISHAADLAERFDAHLAALCVSPMGAPEAARRAQRARKLFEDEIGRRGISTEWREAADFPADIAIVQSRYVDLVVVGQLDPDDAQAPIDNPRPEDIALAVGRPVLVIPYVGSYDRIGQRVLVAWDGSREATRAISDAMPLLTSAAVVTVLTVDPAIGRTEHGELPGTDIALYLARHGVSARVEKAVSAGMNIGDVLLSHAADRSADLLVMGAYGHSRLRELVLGGATRTVLRSMTLPVLLSH